jgi:translation initiation factor 1
MKQNLFEMGMQFDSGWQSDNRRTAPSEQTHELVDPSAHRLVVRREKRRGKVVTIIGPFDIDPQDMRDILGHLRTTLGTGGTIKNRSLELQGDRGLLARDALEAMGYRFDP